MLYITSVYLLKSACIGTISAIFVISISYYTFSRVATFSFYCKSATACCADCNLCCSWAVHYEGGVDNVFTFCVCDAHSSYAARARMRLSLSNSSFVRCNALHLFSHSSTWSFVLTLSSLLLRFVVSVWPSCYWTICNLSNLRCSRLFSLIRAT